MILDWVNARKVSENKPHDCRKTCINAQVICWHPIEGWYLLKGELNHLKFCPWCGEKLKND